jgi:hypothetical protein
VKLIDTSLLIVTLTGLPWLANAKEETIYFNHSTQEEWSLNTPIDDRSLEYPFNDPQMQSSIYCQQLVLENQGEQVLKNCYPFINESNWYTVERLRSLLVNEDHPILTLYRLWNHSLHISQESSCLYDHPLDLLNLAGTCNQEQYVQGFIKLCQLLEISVYPALVKENKNCYDFYYHGEWVLLDLVSQQIYLGLDNLSLVPSEEILDDPFLALRTKWNRFAPHVDFTQGWLHVAHFDVIAPSLPEEITIPFLDKEIKRKQGFDLYPRDQLKFERDDSYQTLIHHVMQLDSREFPIAYLSPLPIIEVKNEGSAPIVISSKVLQPGESHKISQAFCFDIHIEPQILPLTGSIVITCRSSYNLFPVPYRGVNHLSLGVEKNPNLIKASYHFKDELTTLSPCLLKVVNAETVFDHCTPHFQIDYSILPEKIWWQISSNETFDLVPSNFEQVSPFNHSIQLPAITDTFFNADELYYFRVKGAINGNWNDWSEPFAFTVKKPSQVTDIQFKSIGPKQYKISWQPTQDATDYLIFGSNSLDFLPSIYDSQQVNAVVNGEVVEEEFNDNLIKVTTDTKIYVDGSLAYYRIFARHRGQFSVPSNLIHVYDWELNQTRHVLQIDDNHSKNIVMKRVDFPRSYHWMDQSALPIIHNGRVAQVQPLMQIGIELAQTKDLNASLAYVKSPYVQKPVWDYVKPYLLPTNHPIKAKLDRLFSSTRVTQTPLTFKRAGFKRFRPGGASHIMASANPYLQGYFIKAFPDSDPTILEDWKKLVHRIIGANSLRAYLKQTGHDKQFKVPQKWIYPLPPQPSPPSSPYFLRKNFILVAEDMRTYDFETNRRKWKKDITKGTLFALYTILQAEGLYDSAYYFNVPFCKDGKMAFIDTEYHHKWPIPFWKMESALSSKMASYWKQLVKTAEVQK